MIYKKTDYNKGSIINKVADYLKKFKDIEVFDYSIDEDHSNSGYVSVKVEWADKNITYINNTALVESGCKITYHDIRDLTILVGYDSKNLAGDYAGTAILAVY
jgi:hypothetical protein